MKMKLEKGKEGREKGNCRFGFTLERRRRVPFTLYPSLI
jgi:hypothetical protein